MSGSTWGGAIGAGIGFWVTGGSPAGARWGWMIGAPCGEIVDICAQEDRPDELAADMA